MKNLPAIISTKQLINIGMYKNHYEAHADRESGTGPKFFTRGSRIFYRKKDVMFFLGFDQDPESKKNNLYDPDPENIKVMMFIMGTALFISSIIFMMVLVSCTLSFQIIDTHGTATDVVDDILSPKNDVSPTIDLPVTP
jgi:hypothetical protein